MITLTLSNGKTLRVSKVEAERIKRAEMRRTGLDDRKEPRHPNRTSNGRRAMRAMMRWRNKKATGHYGG